MWELMIRVGNDHYAGNYFFFVGCLCRYEITMSIVDFKEMSMSHVTLGGVFCKGQLIDFDDEKRMCHQLSNTENYCKYSN